MPQRLYPGEREPAPPRRDTLNSAPPSLSVEPDERMHYTEEPEPGRGGGWLRLIVILLAAVGGAGALFVLYRSSHGTGGGPIPLIRAESGPIKIKPPDAGGVPDGDQLVYNPTAPQPPPGVERLLPEPEQPMAKPQPLITRDIGDTPTVHAAPPSAVATPPATTAAAGQLVAPPGTKVDPNAQAPITTGPAPSTGGPARAAAVVAPPPSAPAPAPKSPAAATDAAGPFRVQIAATRDEASAQKEWERLRHAQDDLLGTLSPTYHKVDLGDRGVFVRIQAGPLPDKATADKLCADLKARASIGCIVVH